jgi:hypothetical protein
METLPQGVANAAIERYGLTRIKGAEDALTKQAAQTVAGYVCLWDLCGGREVQPINRSGCRQIAALPQLPQLNSCLSLFQN